TPASANESLLVRLGKTTSYHIPTPAVTHYYFITAYDYSNKESGSSNVVTFTPNAPPLPPHLVLSGGPTLTWNTSSEPDVAGYRVYHCSRLPCARESGTATLFNILGKVTSFHIGTPALTQHYLITAYDFANQESDSSNVVTFTTGGQPPPAPAHVEGESEGRGQSGPRFVGYGGLSPPTHGMSE